MRFIPLIFAVYLLASCSGESRTDTSSVSDPSVSSNDSLRFRIQEIIAGKKADIGIAIIGPEGDTLSFRGDDHFAMMSVAKFPQALAYLHLVDEGKIKMDDPIHFTEADMKQRTFSTLPQDHPEPAFDLSIAEALAYSIGQSDNITSNVIFAKEGGPKAVEAYVHGLGIKDIGVQVDYWNLNNDTYLTNWATPRAMALLLQKYAHREILNPQTHEVLWEAMTHGPSGAKRMRYLLPEGTVLARKTGTGNTDDATGRIFALNEVGIIVLPDGKPLIVSVFIANSYETESETEKIIASIARTAFDYYAQPK